MLQVQLQGYPTTASAAKAQGLDVWCTTSTIVSGPYKGQQAMVCFPRTLEMAGEFKGLQRAINDYIAKGVGCGPTAKVSVDGQIGPETLAAVQKIAPCLNSSPPADTASLVENIAQWREAIASAVGATVNLDPDPKLRDTGGGKADDAYYSLAPQDRGLGFWGWALVLGLLGTSGYVGYRAYKYSKKPKKRSKKLKRGRGGRYYASY